MSEITDEMVERLAEWEYEVEWGVINRGERGANALSWNEFKLAQPEEVDDFRLFARTKLNCAFDYLPDRKIET